MRQQAYKSIIRPPLLAVKVRAQSGRHVIDDLHLATDYGCDSAFCYSRGEGAAGTPSAAMRIPRWDGAKANALLCKRAKPPVCRSYVSHMGPVWRPIRESKRSFFCSEAVGYALGLVEACCCPRRPSAGVVQW